jgi:hypothetical protein
LAVAVSAIVGLGVASVDVGESVGVTDAELGDEPFEDALLVSPPIEKTHPGNEEHPTPIDDNTLRRFMTKRWWLLQ